MSVPPHWLAALVQQTPHQSRCQRGKTWSWVERECHKKRPGPLPRSPLLLPPPPPPPHRPRRPRHSHPRTCPEGLWVQGGQIQTLRNFGEPWALVEASGGLGQKGPDYGTCQGRAQDGDWTAHRCKCAKGRTLCLSDPPQAATSLQMRQHFTSCVWPDGFLSLVLRLGSSVR